MNTPLISAIKSAVSRLPLRAVILLPLLTLMVCVAASSTWMVSRHGVAAERNINAERSGSEARRFLNAISHILEYSTEIVSINKTAFRSGMVALADDQALRSLFQDQLQLLDEVDFIGLGRPGGDYIAVDRITEDRSLRVVTCNEATAHHLIIEPAPGPGRGAARVWREDKGEYNATSRPWYQAGVAASPGTPAWSPVFVYATDPIMAINRSLAIRDGSGKVLGVLTVSLNMKRLGETLKGLHYTPYERVFVVEKQSGLLVTTSNKSSLFYIIGNNISRINADESQDIITRLAAGELSRALAGGDAANGGPVVFSSEGRSLMLRWSTLGGTDSPPWIVASVIPLDSALDELAAARRQYQLYALLALGIASMLGVIAAELIARPIRMMILAAKALDEGRWDLPLDEGRWDLPLPVDRKDALGELARALNDMRFRLRQRLVSHLEKMPLAVIELDREFRVRSWNEAATKIFHYKNDDVMGKPAWDLILDPEMQKVVKPIWLDLISRRGGGHSENDNIRKGGQRIRCEWYNSAILDHKGEVTGVISLGRDVTRERQTEEQLRRATREKDEFLAVMSHELRTPLTSVLGNAQLLKLDTALDQDQERYVASILSGCDQVLFIVDQILELRSIESGSISLAEEDFDPCALMRMLCDEVEPRAIHKSLIFEYKPGPDLPTALRGDPQRLRQILDNLLSNALKFTERGRVEMKVRVVNDRGRVVELEFSVEDTGIGISPGDLPRLFKQFSRIDSSLRRRYPGTGLGLATAQGIAQLMGTSIAVDSEQGRGSRFFFKARFDKGSVERILPTLPPSGEIQPARARSPRDLLAPSSPRILCVEDEPSNQRIVKSAFDLFGWETTIVGDGESALECVLKAPFDVVLMDCHLPGMDGFKVASGIRDYERRGQVAGRDPGRPIPIIGFSADILHTNNLALFNTFIEKPFYIDTLLNVICSVVGCPRPEPLRERGAGRAVPGSDAIDFARFVRELRGVPDGEAIARGAVREFAGAGYDFYMGPLESVINSGELDGLHESVHLITGAAKSIRAESLRVAAEAVEAVRLASIDADPESVRSSMDRLRREMRRCLDSANVIANNYI